MPLAAGTRIGSHEILSPLGAGGMGEVYRARDTRLGRDVAIKALQDAFAQDTERLARFEREARLLAALNHPNIAAIYGLEESSGAPYLVLELVEGESLAQRLSRGALSVRETLDVCGQIAAAIEAAHDRGIVHRDLKPQNVMLTNSRTVKVLDFGLAKGGATEVPSSADLTATPTIAAGGVAAGGTAAGLIFGTAAYMSPEQARGLPADRRTDVWALGCLLYECLTARQAFAGDTVSDMIARILEREPDWAGLPMAVPGRLHDLMRRCLTKDPEQRPRDIGDLRRELAAIAHELQGSSSSSGISPASAKGSPSLAVLYFENIASDKESEYFCAGITEDILTDLSKIRGLRVASRNAVARYRGAPVDIARVGAELGVGAVLEGSVRRAGDRVRITVQLISAADGFHMWAERYDRTLEDVFAVQEEIATAIAGALRVALSPAETQQLVGNRPSDVRAYDLYLKGRAAYSRYSRESLHEALELFTEATALDSDYALAWAGIADCRGQMIQWGFAPDVQEAARLGIEAADRAISLNPQLAEGYKARALVLRFSGDAEGSHLALLKAVEVNPRFTPALVNLAVSRFCAADLAGAERFARRALEADPQDVFSMTWIGMLAILEGRSAEALDIWQRLKRQTSEVFYVTVVHLGRMMVLLDGGELEAAEEALKTAFAEGTADPANLKAAQATLAARFGRLEEARRLVLEVQDAPSMGVGALMFAAGAACKMGETQLAIKFMSREVIASLTPVLARMTSALHPLLDLPPLAPRRSDLTLVWPLQAPMIDPARHALFAEVKIESGIPEGSRASSASPSK